MTLGLLAGSFDPLHPGIVWAMAQAVNAGVCEAVVAALHIDPSLERNKPKPALSTEDRGYLLANIKYIAEVIPYATERDLYELILTIRPSVRILGEDYIGKPYTGDDLPIPVFYARRRSDWSGTVFRQHYRDSFKADAS